MELQGRNEERSPHRLRNGGGAVGVLLGILLFFGGASSSAPSTAAPSSFILVVVDALRADFVGTYGFDGESTPYLDELARESVVFERCLAPAPWTKPSMASLLTSLHPETHGLTNHDGIFYGSSSEASVTGILSPRALTLAESLGEAGYQTAAFVANP